MKQSIVKCRAAGAVVGALLLLQAGAALAVPILLSQGLPTTSYYASSIQTPTTSYDAWKAFDGNLATRWQASVNVNPLQSATFGWVEVDLGKEYLLDHITLNLYSLTTPGVAEIFHVYASQTPIANNKALLTPLKTYSATYGVDATGFVTGQVFTVDTSTSAVTARYVQVETTLDYRWNPPATNGYVKPAWEEIQVYGSAPVPEPSTFILLGAGLGGLALLRRRRA